LPPPARKAKIRFPSYFIFQRVRQLKNDRASCPAGKAEKFSVSLGWPRAHDVDDW
jgi:hypothetical protein